MSTSTSKIQLVLLGTGTPNPDPDRFGSSVALVVDDVPYLVDAGPGVVRRAAAAYQQGVKGLEVNRLSTLFLTHHHSDHTAGLPDLMLTPWVLERNQPLKIFGPKGTQSMIDHLLVAYQEDIRERLEGLEQANDVGHRIEVEEIEAGFFYRDDRVEVEAFKAVHGSWPAFGFKFKCGNQTIVLSGDTTLHDDMNQHYEGCDVLIHEVYSANQLKQRPAKWQTYHSSVHTSTEQLAQLANQVQPKLLILYHQLLWGASEQDLLSEIRDHYNGAVVSGNDLDIFEFN